MIDPAASAHFIAGGAFGCALLFAAIVLALVIFFPIGHPDWASFTRGAITLPVLVIVLFGMIAVLMKLATPSNGGLVTPCWIVNRITASSPWPVHQSPNPEEDDRNRAAL